jgi:uncharacterized protein YfiM (DUF2279 family)
VVLSERQGHRWVCAWIPRVGLGTGSERRIARKEGEGWSRDGDVPMDRTGKARQEGATAEYSMQLKQHEDGKNKTYEKQKIV